MVEKEIVPDLCLYPFQELDTRTDTIKMTEPPLCAIEILSPTQSIGDLLAKANPYFQYGRAILLDRTARLG